MTERDRAIEQALKEAPTRSNTAPNIRANFLARCVQATAADDSISCYVGWLYALEQAVLERDHCFGQIPKSETHDG